MVNMKIYKIVIFSSLYVINFWVVLALSWMMNFRLDRKTTKCRKILRSFASRTIKNQFEASFIRFLTTNTKKFICIFFNDRQQLVVELIENQVSQ